MIILVSYTAATYKAQIRSSLEGGFKPLYNASCTMGEEQAAKAVVRKFFNEAAAQSVRQVIDQGELRSHIGDFKSDPQRKQTFTYWVFNQNARDKTRMTKDQGPKDKERSTKHEEQSSALPPLATVVSSIAEVQDQLAAADLQHARNTLADRVWLGCLCLQGKEHHSLPVNARGQGRKKITSTRRTDSEPTALVINPQGFLAWLGLAVPGVAQPTAYKYMDAAKGLGLDAWSTEKEVRKLVAQRLAEFDQREQRLTLAMLAAQGKEIAEPGSDQGPGKKTLDQIKTETVQSLFTFMDEVVSVKDALTPVEADAVINRLGEILHRLTGKEWSPVS